MSSPGPSPSGRCPLCKHYHLAGLICGAALCDCGKSAALPPPADPPGLVALVREWQEARKPVGLSAPGVGVAETYQAAVKRMAAADAALAAFDVGETPEAHKHSERILFERLSQALTNGNAATWDEVIREAERLRDESVLLNEWVPGDPVGMNEHPRSTSLREELAEIIRWRFRTADGAPMSGALNLKRAMEIADEIAPMIEEAGPPPAEAIERLRFLASTMLPDEQPDEAACLAGAAALDEVATLREKVRELRAELESAADRASARIAEVREQQRLGQEFATLRANEGEQLRSLSDALSGGNAATWDEVIDAAATLRARVAQLEQALQGLLELETERAVTEGYQDCTCINWSRDTERAYETGTCPHQAARAALTPETP